MSTIIKDERTCENCVWCRINTEAFAPHMGCYCQGHWRVWLNKEKAKMFPMCMLKDKPYRLLDCEWSSKY